MFLKKTSDVIIIGSGIVGNSLAFNNLMFLDFILEDVDFTGITAITFIIIYYK